MKIDCSITENYLKEKARMIKITEDGLCTTSCVDCPLSTDNNGTDESCANFEKLYPDKAIQIVQKWSNEHPPMTMLEKFKEQHPKAPLSDDGAPSMCPHQLGYEKNIRRNCIDNYGTCTKCWNRLYTEDSE